MMYRILVAALISLAPWVLYAQKSMTEAVRELIAKDSNGAFLLEHSDGYRHALPYRTHRGGMESVVQLEEEAHSQDLSNEKSSQNETTVAISRKDPKTIIVGLHYAR